MPTIAPPNQPSVSVQLPVPTPVQSAPQQPPASTAGPSQDFLAGYVAALQQGGKGPAAPPPAPEPQPAAVSLPPQRPETDISRAAPHTLIFPYLPPAKKRFRPRRRYARVSEYTKSPDYHALLANITPWDKQNDAGDLGHGVLADWLEERGFPAVARHIRESVALAPELPGDISPRYGLPGRTQIQPSQPVMDALHSPSTGKARIVLRLPDKYTPAGDATRMIGVDRRWVSHYMTPAEAAKRVREMGREGVALFRHSTGPGAFGPGGVRYVNTDAKAAKRLARPGRPKRYSHEGFARALAADRFDTLTPQVFADYLDEQGLPGVAEVIRRRVQDAQGQGTYIGQEFHPSSWTGFHLPPEHPVGHPSVFTSVGYGAAADPERQIGFGVLMNVPGTPDFLPAHERAADRRAGVRKRAVRPLYFGISTTPADALRLLDGMTGVRNADRAREVISHAAGRDTRPKLARPGTPRKYAQQVPWATWDALHPEIRHTPLGAALMHVANGHGNDPAATALAHGVVFGSGPHDQPMDLLPIEVLRDYLGDTNPHHPLARAFNWEQLPEKMRLDRAVLAHAAEAARHNGRPTDNGQDWTHYELSGIKIGHDQPGSSFAPDLARAVAGVGVRLGGEVDPAEVGRAADRQAHRVWRSNPESHEGWSPEGYHAGVGHQILEQAVRPPVDPHHHIVAPDDPRRFARAVAASHGASQ